MDWSGQTPHKPWKALWAHRNIRAVLLLLAGGQAALLGIIGGSHECHTAFLLGSGRTVSILPFLYFI